MRLIMALRQGTWLTAERLSVYPKLLVVVYVVFGLAWAAGFHRVLMPEEGAVVTDFVNVYAAGVVARDGHADDAYDWRDHRDLEHRIERGLNLGAEPKRDPGNIPWLYPPMFLGVAWLVAFLPYFLALAAYSTAGLIAYGATIIRLAPRQYTSSRWIIAAFPAVFVNLFAGQNGSITTALLAAGLIFLDQSPLLAGAMFGLLSYKPQFFVLIPLALVVGRYWRALIASLASAALCAALSLAAFGSSSWQGFIDGLAPTRSEILENGSDRWLGILHSVFSMVRIFGGDLQLAYAAQAMVAAVAVAILVWIWALRTSSLAIRGASLAATLLLASPYLFVYDQLLIAIPIALLARQGLQHGFLPYEKSFLVALWLLPFLIQDSGHGFALPLTPPMLIGLVFLCWKRMQVEQHDGVATTEARPASLARARA